MSKDNSKICLENILECIPCCIFWKDLHSVYLGCNQEFANLTGKKSPQEVIGKNDFDLSWEEGKAELFRMSDQKVIANNPIINVEEHLTRPDGSKIVMLVCKVPLFNHEGKCIGLLGILTDITEGKKLKEELKKAKEHAENMNRLKTEFLSNMSHDVKTPLTGIISLSNHLMTHLQEPDLLDAAKNISDCGKSLFKFFDNCVELSQSDDADCTITTELFNLEELFDELTDLFTPAAKAKNLKLEAEYDSQIPKQLLGSRSAIYRIMQNLIDNAIKFTYQGEIHIKIALGEKSTANNTIIIITVQDTGIGISKDKQKFIFDRLMRLTPSHEETYTGVNTGLYLVQKFTHALLGQVYLESTETKGSRFTVALPLQIPLLTEEEYKKVTEPSTISTGDEKQSSLNNTHKASLRVLLIEDNKIALKIAQSIVESMHHHTDLAENSADAIALFKTNKYDLVLTDIGLPDFNGYELTEKLREIEHYNDLNRTPIVALTAHDAANISHKANASGIDAILSKPLSEEKMQNIVESFVYAASSKNLTSFNNFTEYHSQIDFQNPSIKKAIDLEEGAKILGENRNLAQKMLLEFMESLPQTRANIENAFRSKDLTALFDVVHQFYGGLCYVGTPYLRQAAKELENALLKKEEHQVNRLYQRLLDEISSLEKNFSL